MNLFKKKTAEELEEEKKKLQEQLKIESMKAKQRYERDKKIKEIQKRKEVLKKLKSIGRPDYKAKLIKASKVVGGYAQQVSENYNKPTTSSRSRRKKPKTTIRYVRKTTSSRRKKPKTTIRYVRKTTSSRSRRKKRKQYDYAQNWW